MILSKKKKNNMKCDIAIGEKLINYINKLQYLKAIIKSDGSYVTQNSQAKAAYQKTKSIFCNNSLSMSVRKT